MKQASAVLGELRLAQDLSHNSNSTKNSFAPAEKALKTLRQTGRTSFIAACCMIALMFAMSPAARLSAQTFGNISGHVADSTGAVIPDATVTLTNVGTSGKRTTLTTQAGDYTFTAVPVGVYNISATHAGFKTAASNNVALQIQQSMRLDFTLEVGAVTDSVEVSATAALFQAENATIGTVVENKAVNELPLNGRNYLDWSHSRPTPTRCHPLQARPAAAWAAIAPARQFQLAASASCSTTTRWMALTIPIPTSSPMSACPPLTASRSSRCRRVSIRLSSATRQRKSTWSAKAAPTPITALCTTSSATTSRMQILIFSYNALRIHQCFALQMERLRIRT